MPNHIFTYNFRCCVGKGCKRRYHPSCLDPPLDDVAHGDWHCCFCVKKKIELGVYSVSEGVDSVWDAREVEVQDTGGMVNGTFHCISKNCDQH